LSLTLKALDKHEQGYFNGSGFRFI
jgi:hypothetical protein